MHHIYLRKQPSPTRLQSLKARLTCLFTVWTPGDPPRSLSPVLSNAWSAQVQRVGKERVSSASERVNDLILTIYSKPYERKDGTATASAETKSEGSDTRRNTDAPGRLPPRQKTMAELKVEETQRKRAEEKAKRLAAKSHKERVTEFNNSLERQSDHNDMPRIAGG